MSEETYSTQGMQCPHCQHVNTPDDAGDYNEDTHEQWCESCSEVFETSCYVTHSWTSTPMEDPED